MRSLMFFILLGCSGLFFGSDGVASTSAQMQLAVSPNVMNVDIFFSGGVVTISGEIPSAEDVVIEVSGPDVNDLYDLKGRIGPFWMTRGKVQLQNTPLLYMLLLPQGQDWERNAATLGFGVEHLRRQVAIGGSDLPAGDLFQMFVSLKSSEGLYGETPGAVLYTPGTPGRRHFTATYMFPSSTTAGTYTIKATAIANRACGPESSREVTVRETGFVKMVNDLASNQRLTYGVGAVVIALLAGALTGIIFKRGGSH
jgi:hypothetical protein